MPLFYMFHLVNDLVDVAAQVPIMKMVCWLSGLMLYANLLLFLLANGLEFELECCHFFELLLDFICN